MRILPLEQREAMFEIYSFCRKVDDVADGGDSRENRRAQLQQWREAVDACYSSTPPAELSGLVRQIGEFKLAREDFIAVIDGMQMDVDEDVVAPDWATLDLYCDRVASAVGRLSVRVFGLGRESGAALAHHLGRALQMTNIVRDVDEDAALGRLYLPREELNAAGVDTADVHKAVADPAIAGACEAVARRSGEHFAEAQKVMDACPRRAVRAPRLMAAAYGDMLRRMLRQGFQPPRRRVRISKLRLAGAVLTYGVL
jgi:phytoene synthase